jgi:dTDP-4-amino-4,6-dideoxygalactose transaminase
MIPLFDYRPEHRRLAAEIDAAVRRVLDSGRLILGPEVQAFESEFAAWLGSAHAVGVGSGTDALLLALRALGVGAGHEVVTVSNAGVPPVAAVRAAGARPCLVDVDEATLQLDPAGLARAVTPRTRAVIAVHLYGQAAPLDPIREALEALGRTDVALVEDCAQAVGTRYRGRAVGTHGRIGCFSFYPTKNLGAYGDGGLCVTDDPELDRRLRLQRAYGWPPGSRSSAVEGLNSRLDELQAALLRVKLAHLEDALAERRRLAALYDERLAASDFRLPVRTGPDEHTYHLYVVRTEQRAAAIRRLRSADVGYGIHYPQPVHAMDAYRGMGLAVDALPVTDVACASVLSLPLYVGLGESEVGRVVEALIG